jgi:hypothetical protein
MRKSCGKLAGLALALAVALYPGLASAQAAEGSTTQEQINQQLLQRISQLEAQLKQVQEKQQTAAPAAAPAPAPAPEPETAPAGSPSPVQLNLFGDLGVRATNDRGTSSSSFYMGSLDVFMTAHASSRVSGLAEILFITEQDNTVTPDIERLLLQYKVNDHLSAAIGRYHTSIGYYNTAFHQGEWFDTAIGRPFMYAFDDVGGFLPLQEVGITAYGQIPSGKLNLGFVAEMGNGRDHLIGGEPAQNNHDVNNGKAFNLALSARPRWVSGLQLGFSIYHDYLTFSDAINHPELISTVYAVFNNSNYEFLNEAMMVRHVYSSTSAPGIWHTPGFYSQISRRWGKYRPYFRYQYINAAIDEPIYGDPTDGPIVGRRNGPSVGLRYDFTEQTAWKLQYDRLAQRDLPNSNSVATQFAFTF